PIGSVVRRAREGHLGGVYRRQWLAYVVIRGSARCHELVPDLGSGGRRVIELLDRDDPLEADQARVAVIGLELMLVLRGDLAGTTQRRLFRGRRTGAAPDHHAGGGSSPITVCDCSRRNCWT